jgi:acyl-CoA dehydrogenase
MDILKYTEEHRMFRDTLRKFVEKELIPHVEEWEEAGIVPKSVWKKMGSRDFWGRAFPNNTAGRARTSSIRSSCSKSWPARISLG